MTDFFAGRKANHDLQHGDGGSRQVQLLLGVIPSHTLQFVSGNDSGIEKLDCERAYKSDILVVKIIKRKEDLRTISKLMRSFKLTR